MMTKVIRGRNKLYRKKRHSYKGKWWGEMLKHFENKFDSTTWQLKCWKRLVRKQTGETLFAYRTQRNGPNIWIFQVLLISCLSHSLWNTYFSVCFLLYRKTWVKWKFYFPPNLIVVKVQQHKSNSKYQTTVGINVKETTKQGLCKLETL